VIKLFELARVLQISVSGLMLANFAVAENQHLTSVSLSRNASPTTQHESVSLTPEIQAKKLNENGVDLVLKSMPDEGIEAFKKGIELDPANSTLRYNLAGVYLSRGNVSSALVESNKSVELKPEDLSFLHRLGEVHFAAKNYEEAAKLFEKIASLNPEFNEVVFHLGTVYAMQQKWDEAENSLRRAREIYPSHSSIDTNLANVLIMTHKFSEAAGLLEKVSLKEPSAKVNLALGIAYEAAGNDKKALLAYQVAKSLGSTDSQLDDRIMVVQKKVSAGTANQQ
jgi:Flp pilus assembly protein TadD